MISPTQEEIVLDEGDTVEIICSSDESDMMNVDFIYPNVCMFYNILNFLNKKHGCPNFHRFCDTKLNFT